MDHFEVITNAQTGEQTIRPYTPEEIAAITKAKPPETITRRQCALQMLAMGMINGDEAIAMTRDGTPPAAVLAYINALPAADRTYALIDFAATTYYRSNPLIAAMLAANGATSEQGDDFFIAAAAL